MLLDGKLGRLRGRYVYCVTRPGPKAPKCQMLLKQFSPAPESTEANASAQESAEKYKGELTNKLTFLGVFQAYHPRALEIWPILSSAICPTNSRNPHLSLFRTSAGSAHTHNK
uniref:Uncharacterized protein n=1 Tax=Heterorhabditis bacteriophora TaxID=37862 RepID=A0A1I7WIL2_HETBA